MKRRDFAKTMAAVGAGSALGPLATSASPVATTDDLNALPEPSGLLVGHCKKILEQNLLRAGETFVVATPMVFDHEYFLAMLVAAGEIGATGAHLTVFPKISGNEYQPGLTDWHWQTYAGADLLITSSIGNAPGVPGAATAYNAKVGDHPYRTDFELINRAGAKTRWLALGGDVGWQRRYFPTRERRERTLRGAILCDNTGGPFRVTSDAGTDWSCTKQGRPGHAQYGIADMGGRWDNFGYGCVAFMPNEDSAEGTLVLQPGDLVNHLYPQVLDESIKLTFEGGYITKVEGGKRATEFDAGLASYNNPESYGLGHYGWGTHEASRLRDFGHYAHNHLGSHLFALGMNYGHGLGGKGTGYSGSGASTRIAPNHSHFTMFGCDSYVAGQKTIEKGVVAPEAGGML